MNFIFKIILTALCIYASSKVIPGIVINEPIVQTALFFTLILTLLNVTLKPILKLLTFPITCVTLGLFLLVINTSVVMLADHFVENFKINGWQNAFIFSLGLSLISSAIDFLLKSNDEEKKNH